MAEDTVLDDGEAGRAELAAAVRQVRLHNECRRRAESEPAEEGVLDRLPSPPDWRPPSGLQSTTERARRRLVSSFEPILASTLRRLSRRPVWMVAAGGCLALAVLVALVLVPSGAGDVEPEELLPVAAELDGGEPPIVARARANLAGVRRSARRGPNKGEQTQGPTPAEGESGGLWEPDAPGGGSEASPDAAGDPSQQPQGQATSTPPVAGPEPSTTRAPADAEESLAAAVLLREQRARGRNPRPRLDAYQKGLRKKLRGQFLHAYRNRMYKSALGFGRKLEARYGLDWEAEYVTAHAARLSGDLHESFRRFEAFALKYAENKNADDAVYWMGRVLMQLGQNEDARAYFERVASDPESDWRSRARARLVELARGGARR